MNTTITLSDREGEIESILGLISRVDVQILKREIFSSIAKAYRV